MDAPTWFYHATSGEKEVLIRASETLIPQKHNFPKEWMWLVNTRPDLLPPGVWFCATLFNGDLPNISPYGNRRVRIPITDVIHQLGGNVKLYAGVPVQKDDGNIYVRLMLVKGDDNFEILQCMQQQDMANNQWLRLAGEYRVACRPTWVEIYVPYPINVSNGIWDTVGHGYPI